MTRKDRVLFTDELLKDVGDGDLSPHAASSVPEGYVVVDVLRIGRRGDGGEWFDVLSRPKGQGDDDAN